MKCRHCLHSSLKTEPDGAVKMVTPHHRLLSKLRMCESIPLRPPRRNGVAFNYAQEQPYLYSSITVTLERYMTRSATISKRWSHFYVILKLSRRPRKVLAATLLTIPARYSSETCTSNDSPSSFHNQAHQSQYLCTGYYLTIKHISGWRTEIVKYIL
jgi:hypothetical protein